MTALHDAVGHNGFAFVDGDSMRVLLERDRPLADWDAFAASWNDLAPDTYLAQVGRHRRRRHAVFSAARTGPIQREAHQPHYQSLQYNVLQGDIERWFDAEKLRIMLFTLPSGLVAAYLFGAIGLGYGFRRWRLNDSAS